MLNSRQLSSLTRYWSHFKIPQNLSSCNFSTVQNYYSNQLSSQFLKDIVTQHEQEGRRFLLPWGDETAVNQILEPLERLNLEGMLRLFYIFVILCYLN